MLTKTPENHSDDAGHSRGHNASIELTVFLKIGGLLSKKIELIADKVVSDGSACTMAHGVAKRATLDHIGELSVLIEALNSSHAISLGSPRDDLPDDLRILTKRALAKGPVKGTVARTGENFRYRPGRAALVLFDYDMKGMPPSVALQLKITGGFWAAMVAVVPALATAGYLLRLSTSAGLSRSDTGAEFPGSGGLHVYITIRDGSDAVRFLTTVHARCWLAGFGWYVVGAAGQLLERSIIDRMVGAAERLVFEGPPELVPPLQQDAVARKPTVVDGDVIDSRVACPPLGIVDQQRFEQLKAEAKVALADECAAKRAAWIAARVAVLVAAGMAPAAATAMLEKQLDHLLLSNIVLEFDDPDLAGTTVADVLDDPGKYADETLADPVEGIADGRCKAIVMIGGDGLPFIHSFAHGGGVYRLRYNAAAVRAKLEKAADAVAELVRLDKMADLDAIETTTLVKAAAKQSGAGVRDVRSVLKQAREEQKEQRAADARAHAKDDEIAALNVDHALVLAGNKAAVMKFDKPTRFRLLQVEAFQQWFSNQMIMTADGPTTLGSHWLSHRRRRQYAGIEFAPPGTAAQDGFYNLWRGFAVEPKEGDCSKILAHLKDNAARGDDATYLWQVGWWAQIFQQPSTKMETALALRGPFGAGKTKIGDIMGSLLGDHYLKVASERYITGQFNAHMASRLVLHADEAFWAGDKSSVGSLRDLVTGKDHMLEYKGVDPINIKNFIRLFVTGNPDWMVPAGFKERRWAIFDMGKEHAQDHAYFAAIDQEMDNGGREALLHFLLNFDLKQVNLRVIPKTAALLDQQIESMTAEQAWWFQTLMKGELPLVPEGATGTGVVLKEHLYQHYILHARLQGIARRSIEVRVGKFLTDQLGAELKNLRISVDGRRSQCYGLPPLEDCRRLFAAALGQPVDWGVPEREVEDWQHDPDWRAVLEALRRTG